MVCGYLAIKDDRPKLMTELQLFCLKRNFYDIKWTRQTDLVEI